MRQRLLPHPVLSLVLALIWMLLVNSFAPGHLLLGLLFGWMIPLFTRSFWPEQIHIAKPLVLLRFIAIVLFDIVIANLTVALLILGRPKHLQPRFVELPLDLHNDLAISLLANTISLTPGTVSTRLSEDHRYLLVHALHETDIEAMIARIKQRYEAPLKEVFES